MNDELDRNSLKKDHRSGLCGLEKGVWQLTFTTRLSLEYVADEAKLHVLIIIIAWWCLRANINHPISFSWEKQLMDSF